MSDILNLIFITLHVLGAAIIIGGLFAASLLLLKERVTKDNLEYLKYLWRFLTPAVGVQILTGIYLASREWDEFANNPVFWLKIGLLVADGFIGGRILGERLKSIEIRDKKEVNIPGAKKLILLSFLIFITIATLGVFLVEM